MTISTITTGARPPVSTSSETFVVKGQAYQILRFVGDGPNLPQTRAIEKSMKARELLTLEDAIAIRDDRAELNAAFKKALKPGEWGHIDNPKSQAAYLYRNPDTGNLVVYLYARSSYDARVVIFKVIDTQAADQIAPESHLRKESEQK